MRISTYLRQFSLTCAFFLLLTRSALAAEWVIGLGADDLFDSDGDPAFAALAEVHSDPFAQLSWADFSLMASLLVDSERDVFVGVGVHSLMHFNMENYFFEFSLAAGAYYPGGESPPRKETDTFQYRTSIGVGYRLTQSSRLSLTLDHLFNSEFRNYEPGSESILLRYARDF